jgi:hypothetical protein
MGIWQFLVHVQNNRFLFRIFSSTPLSGWEFPRPALTLHIAQYERDTISEILSPQKNGGKNWQS